MHRMTKPAALKSRLRVAFAPAVVMTVALGLAGCQTANDGYPSPYGPSQPTPLPPVAGGGLWNPAPLRATGYGAATLISRLPRPERVAAPARSSQTPELMTREQQIARENELRALRDRSAGAMERRLQSQGRVRAPRSEPWTRATPDE
ncbi:hypothetical protein E8L99_18580 [Phreatobacter aquaticus]|uniref:DUF3035 domain-containing protein n=1 Tax=Phreatobacter aquaticus TaxID=2570229 RepID=A0A4D7QIX5_9HYPH|nr:hypothetical protein [Phreatobacter aquaticus]QCK87620.1 hypothetical protein E8L99_18580 [Phreatobacter aquaticus]